MIRTLFILLFFQLISFENFAQEKVIWSTTFNSKSTELVFTAQIADGWHLYSQFIQKDIGPVPTQFTFDLKDSLALVGEISESKSIKEYDENFEAELSFFKTQAIFRQKIKKGSQGEFVGYITYMVCNDVTCLPPVDQDFKIIVP